MAVDVIKRRARRRRYYRNNKALHYRWDKKKRTWRVKKVNEVKDKPCMDCGIKYPPYVMQFDHRPGTKKIGSIAAMVRHFGWNKTLVKEIAKCDLVCANCHAYRTWRRGQYRARYKKQKGVVYG